MSTGSWLALLSLGRRLPPGLYTNAHFIGQERPAATRPLQAQYCSCASNLVSTSVWFLFCSVTGTPRGPFHSCCFQVFYKSRCSKSQFTVFSKSQYLFFFEPHERNKNLVLRWVCWVLKTGDVHAAPLRVKELGHLWSTAGNLAAVHLQPWIQSGILSSVCTY